jgi:hypothetical protein
VPLANVAVRADMVIVVLVGFASANDGLIAELFSITSPVLASIAPLLVELRVNDTADKLLNGWGLFPKSFTAWNLK